MDTMDLPLTDPRCNSDACLAYAAAAEASQAQISWLSQFAYGEWFTYYYIVITFLFACVYGARRWKHRKARPAPPTPSIVHKSTALFRLFTYRRWHSRFLALPSFGMIAFGLFNLTFITALSFGQRPYYRDHRGYGAPPLAVRAGLIAVALTPIIVALSGKFNIITMLTGISYERLNRIHQWAAWLCLYMSILHTVPFIVAPLRDGGAAALYKQWYEPRSDEYDGTAAFAVLVFLVLFSNGYVRKVAYEAFAWSHYAAFIAYLGAIFWHGKSQVQTLRALCTDAASF